MANINELAERCSERLNVGGASNGATRPRKRAKTAGWVPHTAIFFQEVAPLAAFSVCGRFGCRLPDHRKKEKVPKRKKYYQILYFSLYK